MPVGEHACLLGTVPCPLAWEPTPAPRLPSRARWRTVVDHINGGVFLLRPCAAVEAHMVHLLDAHPKLRFVHGTAEQDFFGW